jgi:hypothetical protein
VLSWHVYGFHVMLYCTTDQTRKGVRAVSEPDKDAKAWRPPYMSYETLANFFDKKIGDNPLPPRIDTHFLDNYAGSVRPLLITALKTMGMLDDNNRVLEPLHEAARGPGERKAVFRAWATDFYADQIALAGQHATAQMLWESFSKRGGVSGSTLRRAVIFYLALANDIGLPLSAHFKAPKASSSSPRPSRTFARQQPEDVTAQILDGSAPDLTTAPEQRDVKLGTAGTVSIIVNVRWLDLSDDQFTKLRKLIKDIEALGKSGDDNDEEDAEVLS